MRVQVGRRRNPVRTIVEPAYTCYSSSPVHCQDCLKRGSRAGRGLAGKKQGCAQAGVRCIDERRRIQADTGWSLVPLFARVLYACTRN